MEKIFDFLKELQFSDTEAKLYISLLESGPSSVRDIALKIGLKRTTAYLYIENLMKKGLITKTILNSRSQISPVQPEEVLTALVRDTIENTKSIETKLPDVVDNIKSAFPGFQETDKFEIKQYKGVQGIRAIYDEAFKSHELRTYVKLTDDEEVFTDNVGMFDNAFKTNQNLRIKEIIYKSSKANKEAEQITALHTRYSYKFLPEDMHLTSEDVLIYDGKVAIIHYRSKEICNSMVLQSIDYYNNSKEFFDFIWKMIPSSST